MAYATKHRTKKVQQLMWRWTDTLEIRKAGTDIQGRLSCGKSIAGFSPFGMHEGFEDFRGYPIGVPANERYPVLGEPRIAPITGCRLWDRSEARAVQLSGFDFSYANFSDFPFTRCRIEGCKFESSVFNGSSFDGCTILGIDFRNCDMRYIGIGTSGPEWDEEDSYIRECSFTDCSFSDSSHRSSTFELCEFQDCTYTFGNWLATRFINCKISGWVYDLTLNGVVRDYKGPKLYSADPGLTEQTIDFSEAQLKFVFLCGSTVDYSKCQFPCDEDQFVMQDQVPAFEEAWPILSNQFQGDQEALDFLDARIGIRLDRYEQGGKLVDNEYYSPSNVAVVTRRDSGTKNEKENIAAVREAIYALVRKIAERDGKIIR